MIVNKFFSTLNKYSIEEINSKIESICGIVNFFENTDDISEYSIDHSDQQAKEEYGDWQTNLLLSDKICKLIKSQGYKPQIILEPTCGKGSFILSALENFDTLECIYGVEIYKPYLIQLKRYILEKGLKGEKTNSNIKIFLFHENIFNFDFSNLKEITKNKNFLMLGNPPWVTNSKLSSINSINLPKKNNYKNIKGIDAITGKGNFDIAEYICQTLINNFPYSKNQFAFLVKNSVIKNIVENQHKQKTNIIKIEQYNIDAKKEFNVSVSASLLNIKFGGDQTKVCNVFDIYTMKHLYDYGWINNRFVSNISNYSLFKNFDGISPFEWWSGLKHDSSKIMELSLDSNGKYINGYNEIVEIEEDLIFPLIKSSDISNNNIESTRKFVIVTQRFPTENTSFIKYKYPKTYEYLEKHSDALDNRKSIIYRNRPRFCMFGIGDYSFKKYKVAISSMYKHTKFSLIKPINEKVVMLDDTCYFIGCDNLEEATLIFNLLNAKETQDFIQSLTFNDAKRIINKDILMRIDIYNIFKELYPQYQIIPNFICSKQKENNIQLNLFD